MLQGRVVDVHAAQRQADDGPALLGGVALEGRAGFLDRRDGGGVVRADLDQLGSRLRLVLRLAELDPNDEAADREGNEAEDEEDALHGWPRSGQRLTWSFSFAFLRALVPPRVA